MRDTVTMNGDKDINSDIRIHMGKSKFSKNEVRSINGVIMKKLFTIKYRVINNNSINIVRDRSITIKEGKTRDKEKE